MACFLHFSVCSLSLVMTFIPMTSVIFMLVIPKPLSLAHILCRDLNYPKPGWLWNISAWYILKMKVKVTQSCPTHFYLVRLEKPESQHVQKELILYFSLLLISNQLLSPLFYFVFWGNSLVVQWLGFWALIVEALDLIPRSPWLEN